MVQCVKYPHSEFLCIYPSYPKKLQLLPWKYCLMPSLRNIFYILSLWSYTEVWSTLIDRVVLDMGDNIGAHVALKLRQYITSTSVEVLDMSSMCGADEDALFTPSSVLVALGNSSTSGSYISADALNDVPYEGFIVKRTLSYRGTPVIACNGRPFAGDMHPNASVSKEDIHYGAVTGAYYVMEMLGFGFLHPLSVHVPTKLTVNMTAHKMQEIHTEFPRWPERNFHVHTQHPLELNEVLQGMDVPMGGPLLPNCKDYHATADPGQHEGIYCERWEDMVADVDAFFQWAVANRLNKVEWMLLGNYKWGSFDSSDMRQKRLRVLTSLGHQYGLLVGADVTLGNTQQHAWYMVNPRLPFHKQVKQIHKRVDWVFEAGFDFLTTESGMSEFTHPDCSLMLDLLNEYATYVNITWGREAAVKVHCSTGQTCQDVVDPRTGDPINFNFLPYHAHSALGVMPHTVQVYGLDDPIGGSYGNRNFREMEEYMYLEAATGNRSVVYYGETAYWVSVDIDVPLFLPLYGQRRLHDLRRIARTEEERGFRIQGQMNFDSGWEWGYWLNDVITARSSWNPQLEAEDDWAAMETSLEPFTRILGPRIGHLVKNFLVELTRSQLDLLVFGRVNCSDNREYNDKLSGIAYLSGSDTYYDIPRMFGLKFTQPDKVHMDEVGHPLYGAALELLRAMEERFTQAHKQIKDILLLAMQEIQMEKDKYDQQLDRGGYMLLEEVRDAVELLAMRARHVRLLYESRAADASMSHDESAFLQGQARSLLGEASEVVRRREAAYRVPWQRIASWRENPTVYRFGYLWAVHSLYYWWRDQGLSERGSLQSQMSPCYLNRMDASEVAVGWGKKALEILRYLINTYSPFSPGYPLEIVNCIAPPSKEYTFPRDLFHHHF